MAVARHLSDCVWHVCYGIVRVRACNDSNLAIGTNDLICTGNNSLALIDSSPRTRLVRFLNAIYF